MITLGLKLSKVAPPRAAIIPYVIIEEEIFFLLGIDSESGDITDLGGGVKKFESALIAAFREFNEESNEILGPLHPNDFWRCVALLDSQMGSLFIPLPSKWYNEAPIEFERRKGSPRKKSHSEISELVWFSEKDFQKMLSSKKPGKKLWKRLRIFYNKGYSPNISKALHLAYPY